MKSKPIVVLLYHDNYHSAIEFKTDEDRESWLIKFFCGELEIGLSEEYLSTPEEVSLYRTLLGNDSNWRLYTYKQLADIYSKFSRYLDYNFIVDEISIA